MGLPEISALTGLVGVIATVVISTYSIKNAARQAERSRLAQYELSLAPRRNDAYETAWQLVFEAESQGLVPKDLADQMVAQSLWLPAHIRSAVFDVVSQPTGRHEFSRLRSLLSEASGAATMELKERKR